MAGRKRFTAREIDALNRPGRYGDGDGLWLQVTAAGTKSWLLRYQRDHRSRHMGLGPYPEVPLAEARKLALEARRLLLRGTDPIEHRESERSAKRERKAALTFEQAASRYISDHRDGWKNEKHAEQWESTLKLYAFPLIGRRDPATLTPTDIEAVLKPIWIAKQETASRLRGRIERILDWCKTHGYRSGENPARWRGNLDHLLPKPSKVRKVKHHRALPWRELPAFMERLAKIEGMGARALEFVILTAARSGEVRGATWDEIDLDAKVWTVPAERMKGGRTHRVPLSDEAVNLLRSLSRMNGSPFVFFAVRGGKLSDMTVSAVCRRMGVDAVPHGFRSTFRDWTAEATGYPREVCEEALAHVNPNKVEAAYMRTDLFERRREMMQEWAAYCGTGVAGV